MSTKYSRLGRVFVASVILALPSLAFAASPQIEAFAQQPIMQDARLSPDGTQIAFLSSLQGQYHVVIERFKPEFERYVVYINDDLVFEWVDWASNDRLLISASMSARRSLAGTSETRLFSVNSDGSNVTPIIKPEKTMVLGSRVAKNLASPQVQDNIVDWLVDQPDHVLVALDADYNGFDEVRRVDISNGNYTVVVDDFAGHSSWISDQTGEVRIAWESDFENDESVCHYRNAKGDWQKLADTEWMRAGFRPVAFTSDPAVAYMLGPNDAGISVVRTMNVESGEFLETVFEHSQVDAVGIISSDFDRRPVGVAYTFHLPEVEYFDPAIKKLQDTINKSLPATNNRIESTSKDRRQILIYSYSDTNLGSYYLWDRDEKNMSLYSDRIPDMNDGLLSPVEAVAYAARDGINIPGYLTVPKGATKRNLPAVVLPHGGPGGVRDDKTYDYLSQYLASQGYAVLRPNFRGSNGYGEGFAAAGMREWGGKMQDDVTDGARWLIEQGIANPERLCIVGWSYGGYAAAMGLIKTPELFQCGVSINGVLNLPRLIQDDKEYIGGTEWTRHVGLEGDKAKAVSPLHQADKIVKPVLIIQAEDDPRVHKDQGRSMAKRLESLGKEHRYVEIQFGGHSVRNVEGRKKILQSVGEFLAEHIG